MAAVEPAFADDSVVRRRSFGEVRPRRSTGESPCHWKQERGMNDQHAAPLTLTYESFICLVPSTCVRVLIGKDEKCRGAYQLLSVWREVADPRLESQIEGAPERGLAQRAAPQRSGGSFVTLDANRPWHQQGKTQSVTELSVLLEEHLRNRERKRISKSTPNSNHQIPTRYVCQQYETRTASRNTRIY